MRSGIRILGLVLLALGVTSLVLGMNETDTFANRFHEGDGRNLSGRN